MTRSYIPATFPLLRAWYDAPELPDTLDRFVPDDDSEEAEYSCLGEAAGAAAELFEGRPGRRVVLVIDPDPGSGRVPWRLVVAVHVDTEELTSEQAGSSEAPELAWFATQEIADLLAV